ncbi:ATP-binding cassette, sub-B (MDR TAP), member 4 [Modicella reniformis]|uniref:ATP-binding cassette, sub-B (MDR TAP), member 4 n=1 Tax=Modicella reniformis TaxID=1440133 RepID=A0A9P6M9I0_9FUNG|nr:ATP-binding cassette, sub-B (MDR TAP), member 4 [Modicella reniformis]
MEKVEVLPTAPASNGTRAESKKNNKKTKNKKDDKAKDEQPKVSYFQLYRFADTWTGLIANNVYDIGDSVAQVRIVIIKFTVMGAIIFVVTDGQMCLFTLSAENQTKRIRERYLHAVLHQDIAWHDTTKKSEPLNSRLSVDTQWFLNWLTRLACFVAIAFENDRVLFTAAAFMAKFATQTSEEGQDAYAAAGGVAEQAISSIRTVVAFDDQAYGTGVKKAIATGVGMGGFMVILFLSYALAFWYGSLQVRDGKMESDAVLTVLFGVLMGAFSIGNLNIEVKPGQTVALVGHSGSGKSTIVGLLERFYDPSSGSGSITLDDHNLKELNVRYLRDSIGLVSQESILFNAAIKRNIIYGIRKGQGIPTDKEIEQACRLDNAHDFISMFPRNTVVGERGTLLSGGQNQRIAIARTIIKNPRILLLDEATSALDTESERIVQAALDKAAMGGIDLESGTHESLMARGGIYSEFVSKQQLKTGTADTEAQPEAEETSAPKIAIVETTAENVRSAGKMGSLLRHMSSHHSVTGCIRSGDGPKAVDVPEDQETSIACQKKEEARKLKMQKAPIKRTIKYLRDDIPLCLLGVILAWIVPSDVSCRQHAHTQGRRRL